MAPPDTVDLDEEMMDLSQVAKTLDGEGFAYTQLDCISKMFGSVKILENYPHLRQIDLSSNCISDVAPIGGLQHLLKLTLAGNRISGIGTWGPDALKYLLHLDLSGNKMTALPKLFMPAVKSASFARNEIASCKQFGGHLRLQELDLSKNSIEDLTGLCSMPLLEKLNLSENSKPAVVPEDEEQPTIPATGLKSIAGLEGLPALTQLDISKNIFETLAGAWSEMPSLSQLIVKSNSLEKLDGITALSQISLLKKLDATENKLVDEVNIRIEALILNAGIALINDEEVQDAERDEAKETHATRVKEEREKRLAEEEAARAAAEEAAAAAAAAAGGGE